MPKKNPCTKCDGSGKVSLGYPACRSTSCSRCEGTGKFVSDERAELRDAKREINAASKAEWEARQRSRKAQDRYAKAYEAVTGEPYQPSILREEAESFVEVSE
jgi:RecJ-like exonuclease